MESFAAAAAAAGRGSPLRGVRAETAEMAAQKINEGLEHIAKAEKYLKTGFLKWKPDYDSAATEYGKAAVAFKNAKQFDQAKDACLREAAAHENNRAYLFSII